MTRVETFGSCTLYLGDSYELANTYELAPKLYGGAVVTDPPYEFETSGGGRFRRSRENMDQIQEACLDEGFDYDIITELGCNSCVVFCHNDQLPELLPYMAAEYDKFALCAYHKSNPMPVANKHYQPDTEYYIHAWNRGFHPIGELCHKKRYYMGQSGKDVTIDHPTVKPLALMEKIIINTNAETVIDPFMGSGTTGVACIRHGRSFIGIEINEKFFDIACKRIEAELNSPSLFGCNEYQQSMELEGAA